VGRGPRFAIALLLAVALGASASAFVIACSPYDAATTEPDGSTTDSGVDNAGDGDALDGTIDQATDLPPVAFCAIDAGSFCEAFDDANRVTFDVSQIDDGGAIDVVQDPRVSPPNALRMRLARPAPSGGMTCSYVTRARRGLGLDAPNGFLAEYKVRFGAPVAGRVILGIALRMTSSAGKTCDYFMEVSTASAALDEFESSGAIAVHPLKMKPPNGVWTAITVDLHGTGSNRKLSVTIDGKEALSDSPSNAACQGVNVVSDIDLGLICVENEVGGDVDVAFDDIRVTAR
jgi:hypothetical protein